MQQCIDSCFALYPYHILYYLKLQVVLIWCIPNPTLNQYSNLHLNTQITTERRSNHHQNSPSTSSTMCRYIMHRYTCACVLAFQTIDCPQYRDTGHCLVPFPVTYHIDHQCSGCTPKPPNNLGYGAAYFGSNYGRGHGWHGWRRG